LKVGFKKKESNREVLAGGKSSVNIGSNPGESDLRTRKKNRLSR